MPSAKQQFGSWAESRAEEFLRRQGFVILARHVTSRYGEIDLLAVDNNTLVAVEVKARRPQNFGRAIQNITPVKLERLSNTIRKILAESHWPEERVRLDVVTVEPGGIAHLIGVG